MNSTLAGAYKSRSQIARIVTEDWALHEMYCAACDSDKLRALKNNARAADYECPRCGARFQLKSGAGWSERSIPDAGYDAMIEAIRGNRVPNLLVMQYSADWRVRNLLLIPSFFFTSSAIRRRRPLGPYARRAGWIGCNIVLSAIAREGKLPVVSDGVARPARSVRSDYARARPLSRIKPSLRGWTLDVLRMIQRINRTSINLNDIYAFEGELCSLYPRNSNVRPKIRQQLQVLRDLGFLRFTGKGTYEIAANASASLS